MSREEKAIELIINIYNECADDISIGYNRELIEMIIAAGILADDEIAKLDSTE